MLVDGVVNIVGAIQHRENDGWVLLLLLGILGALVGAYALFNPPVTMIAFLYVVSFMALMFGVLMVSLGRKVRQEIDRVDPVSYRRLVDSVRCADYLPAGVCGHVGGVNDCHLGCHYWHIADSFRPVRQKVLPEHVGQRLDSAR